MQREKTIAADPNDHARLIGIAGRHSGMSIKGALCALLNLWESAAPEQHAQAIRINVADGPLGSPLDPDTADPRREGLRLGCDATRLNVALDEMLRDEQIDKAEGRRLREYLRQIVKRAENIDRASTRKRSRKGAAA